MAIQSDHHDHWIDSKLEELLLMLAIFAVTVLLLLELSPFALF